MSEKEFLIDLYDDFEAWDKHIKHLKKWGKLLPELEKKHEENSIEIINKAKEENFDFKAKYGANDKAARQKYADEQLQSLTEEIATIKLEKEHAKREIAFLKRMIDMKIELIKYQD